MKGGENYFMLALVVTLLLLLGYGLKLLMESRLLARRASLQASGGPSQSTKKTDNQGVNS